MESTEIISLVDTLKNAIFIVNNTKDCRYLFRDVEIDINEFLVDTPFAFLHHGVLERFSPRWVIVDKKNISKETLEKIVNDVELYNIRCWKYHLDQVFDDTFVEKSKYCFYSATTYIDSDIPFCSGFNCHKGDTKDIIYENHRCKVLLYENGKLKEYK